MTPAEMLKDQGFYPLPGAFASVAGDTAALIKEELKKPEFANNEVGVGDAFNKLRSVQDFLYHDAVRAAYGKVFSTQPTFLQACDIHNGFVQGNWHKDCANKHPQQGRDWDESKDLYRNYKLMIYLECDDYSFCVKPRSNRKKKFFDKAVTDDYFAVSVADAANTNFSKIGKSVQFLPQPGDAVMFDLRTTHRGQGLNSAQYSKRASNKLTLSYVFADRNPHAHRFHSFRTMLKQGYRPLNDGVQQRLSDAGLWWETLRTNYFDTHKDEMADVVIK
ncbi:hypothetical protein [Methylopila sp. M107]|uniref:hypothetical protein n=1 Tax=Methylopila sp. M107 TaxID=1101190 RepID=UPI00058C4994|nr:hypothetical protein [Methylopila sp. M107]